MMSIMSACNDDSMAKVDDNLMAIMLKTDSAIVEMPFPCVFDSIVALYDLQNELYLMHPYTFLLNKYIDLSLLYLDPNFSFSGSIVIQNPLSDKLEKMDEYVNFFMEEEDDTEDDDDELGISEEMDEYFGQLYTMLLEDIRRHPYVIRVTNRSNQLNESFAGLDGVTSDTYKFETEDADEDNLILSFGSTNYDMMDLLMMYEHGDSLTEEEILFSQYKDGNDLYATEKIENVTEGQIHPNKVAKQWIKPTWPGNRVRYRFDTSNSKVITYTKLAMNVWANASNQAIKYCAVKNNFWNRLTYKLGLNWYVRVSTQNKYYSSSNIGFCPWSNMRLGILVDEEYFLSQSVHEMGHVLGLIHEHQRKDRDDYIIVYTNRVPFAFRHNFRKRCFSGNYSEFDFQSVMMYGSYAFMPDTTRPSMTRLDGSKFQGGGDICSDKDKIGIRKLYK